MKIIIEEEEEKKTDQYVLRGEAGDLVDVDRYILSLYYVSYFYRKTNTCIE